MSRRSANEILEVGRRLTEFLPSCTLCPMDCQVNRLAGETGKCHSAAEIKIASYNLHFGEEPPLSGGGGSGTVFFANCPLFCRFCQNYPISQMGTGRVVSHDELAGMMLELQKRGAENINWVTPDHMLPMAVTALGLARQKGLNIPLVYNCSGYEKAEILRHLEGIVDVYLVDMRYNDDSLALKYSGCKNYAATNRAAVREMFRQVGNLTVNDREIAESGVIIRHLVLPEGLSGSAEIFRFLAEEVSSKIFVSLMSQYFPAYRAVGDAVIGRRITIEEFDRAVEAFYEAGLENGFIQELSYEEV